MPLTSDVVHEVSLGSVISSGAFQPGVNFNCQSPLILIGSGRSETSIVAFLPELFVSVY